MILEAGRYICYIHIICRYIGDLVRYSVLVTNDTLLYSALSSSMCNGEIFVWL